MVTSDTTFHLSRRKQFHLYLKNEKLFRLILHVGSLKTCKKKLFSKLAGRRFTIGFSRLFLVFEQIYKIGKNSIISKFHFSRPPWFADKKIYGPRNTPETFWAFSETLYFCLSPNPGLSDTRNFVIMLFHLAL